MITTERVPYASGWWKHLNGYQWYVFVLAAFGWLFDTMDQQIFTTSRSITMAALFPGSTFEDQAFYGRLATSIFIVGWATGGLIFGILGDKWGRAKTMAAAIFVYAAFTGFSGLAKTYGVFATTRFLTGVGVGGEFAVGAALVAEVMPQQSRAGALGMLQALSALGNLLGAYLLGKIVPMKGSLGGWQGLYFIGATPALLAVFVFFRLREPEKWVTARQKRADLRVTTKEFGSLSQLFGIPRWRRNTLVGLGLVTAGALTLWGAGFFIADLIDSAIPTVPAPLKVTLSDDLRSGSWPALTTLQGDDAKAAKDLLRRLHADAAAWANFSAEQKASLANILQISRTKDEKTKIKSRAAMLQQLGAFAVMSLFGIISGRFGHKKTFVGAFLLGWLSVVVTFCGLHREDQVWYLSLLLGAGTLAPFGGYAIYLPELFPTRLRSTGISFCYNVARYLTAAGIFLIGPAAVKLNGTFGLEGFRVFSLAVSCAYLLGFFALIWAPETSGHPLPDD
jgi:MFS family permease